MHHTYYFVLRTAQSALRHADAVDFLKQIVATREELVEEERELLFVACKVSAANSLFFVAAYYFLFVGEAFL